MVWHNAEILYFRGRPAGGVDRNVAGYDVRARSPAERSVQRSLSTGYRTALTHNDFGLFTGLSP